MPVAVPAWLVKLLGGAAVLACVWLHGCGYGERAERDAHKATKKAHAAVLADLAAKTRTAADKAKSAADANKAARAAADQELQEAKADAKRESDDLRRRLRDGSVQLRDWWACDLPGAAAGDAAADGTEARAAERADSATRIVAAADVDAAVIGWLWASWQADRKAVIDAGCAVEAE